MLLAPEGEKAARGVSGRRDFLKASVAGTVGAALSPAGTAAHSLPATARRPNIIYIHSHDTGRLTSPYGVCVRTRSPNQESTTYRHGDAHKSLILGQQIQFSRTLYGFAVPTPNIQRLAEEGILFRQAFNAAPTCSPSRASLLTGECPHSNGMLGLVNRGFQMTPEGYTHHIVRTLRREAGYQSALIGLQHIARDPHTIGYDHVEVIPGNRVANVAPRAARWLQNSPQEPFWLTVGFFETHRPYHKAAPADDTRYIQPPEPIPDVPASRQDMGDFHATVRTLDWGVGEVMAALAAAGLAENTLVISTTDHGIAWPMMKCNLFDGGMGVHLVMRGPGIFTGGKVCNAMVSHLDIYPTFCELLQISPPEWLQGRSFLPVLRGEKEEINEAIFSEVNYHASYEPKRAVRTRRWKYIRHYGGRRHPVLPNCDDGLTKSYWVKHGWAKEEIAPEALYDLVFDPNERNNLAGDAAHRSALVEMRQRMDKWMQATNDPLLRGPVPTPHGARYNDPDQISPGDPVTTVP